MAGIRPYFIQYVEQQVSEMTSDDGARDYVEGVSDALWLLQHHPELVADIAQHENLQEWMNQIRLSLGMDEELYEFREKEQV